MLGRWLRQVAVVLGVVVGLLILVVLLYLGRLAFATKTAVADYVGTRTGMDVSAPTMIARDARGVPHIRARSVRDLFVAEGYAMGSDRLFQMDVSRRFVYGRLAEMLGAPLARVDLRMRRYNIAKLASETYAHTSPEERLYLDAFAAGINAAATREPTPAEFQALFFGFEPWKPEDSIAVGFATVLDLDDKPSDVVVRDEIRQLLGPAGTDALYPLTDPKYDVPTNGKPSGAIARLPALPGATEHVAAAAYADDRPPVGSNGWVVGAARSTVGKAMLANDPHLDIGIPGIWYLVEASAPGMHIAGAALAGTPGVTLGHNEHLAWGVTAGETAAMRVIREPARGTDEVYENGRWIHARHRHERIIVRFKGVTDGDVLETDHGVVIQQTSYGEPSRYLMDWRLMHRPVSTLAPFSHLLTAKTVEDGVAAMRDLPEPALNVLLADDTGRATYHFAGGVPMEPSWGRWASKASDPEPQYLAYDAAPRVDPSRDVVVVTSNNRSDGAGSPRLAPFWPPPYRAFEVERALNASADARKRLSPDAVAVEQRDATSPAEKEFAGLVLDAAGRAHVETDTSLVPLLAALRSFDGTLVPESRGASAVVALRRRMIAQLAAYHLPADLAAAYPPTSPGFEVVLRALREKPRGWVPHDDYDAFIVATMRHVQSSFGTTIPTFGDFAAQPLTHSLAAFGFTFWNGPTMPGRAGGFAPAVQWNGHAQSFRAMWIVGDWDNGTIDIDAGESGEPGSPHYADQTAGWVSFVRTPLPFSDGAVQAATVKTLTLTR